VDTTGLLTVAVTASIVDLTGAEEVACEQMVVEVE
jgi:hypothetical protein